MKCELCHMIEEEDASPDTVCPDLLEVTRVIKLASNIVRSNA